MPGSDQVQYYSRRGTIYLTPSHTRERQRAHELPLPQFRPRQRRPQSIHVTRLPPGYPLERSSKRHEEPPPPPKPSKFRSEVTKFASRETAKKALSFVFNSHLLKPAATSPSPSGTSTPRSSTPECLPARPATTTTTTTTTTTSSDNYSHHSNSSNSTHLERLTPIASAPESGRMAQPAVATPTLLANNWHGSETSLRSIHSASSGHVREEDKPVATGNGVSCSIILNEPHVFLTGFDHDGRGYQSQNSCAILRGKLRLDVTKSVKIKAVTLKFTGRARTEWPEGLPPEKTKYSDSKDIRTTVMPFFNAMYADAEFGYGSQCVFTPRDKPHHLSSNLSALGLKVDRPESPAQSSFLMLPVPMIGSRKSSAIISSREQKRLSLGSVQSRSFSKGESPPSNGPTPQQKGYKVFHPGTYEYNFEIAIDHTAPETIDVPLGSVKWELEASVERAGTFKANLLGTREVKIIRTPDQNSLEQVEPIAISRNWEDQLHYEIVISGKSFPIGSKIPIGFKLTPLAKVQLHRIKIYVTENIEYFTHDNRITRKDGTRKILLFEKHAGKPIAPQYAQTEVRTLSGGEQSEEERAEARRMAQSRRDRDARLRGAVAEPLPARTENLLGDIDLGLEHLITSTEFEMNVQLPTCQDMKKDKRLKIHPDTTYRQIQIHHWIKVVLRLSKQDTEDPTGTKRRHFEISIDSPFHILSCLADLRNTSLPRYTEFGYGQVDEDRPCGCADAGSETSSPASTSTEQVSVPPEITLTRPPQAHIHNRTEAERPNNILRNPSFGPPPFDEEAPPPPLQTPPPDYDLIAGTPSCDTLGDYFRRLADAYSDSDHTDDEGDLRLARGGRVNVANPRTPGGRIARSMEIDRNFMFRPGALEERASRRAANV